MIILRLRLHSRSDRSTELGEALAAVVGPARAIPGVITFDIGRDLTDPDVYIATEVFEDRAARDRQEALPQVASVMALLPQAIAGPPEMAVYETADAAVAS